MEMLLYFFLKVDIWEEILVKIKLMEMGLYNFQAGISIKLNLNKEFCMVNAINIFWIKMNGFYVNIMKVNK
jgi:hypothetical protein